MRDNVLSLRPLMAATGLVLAAPVSYTHLDVYKRQVEQAEREADGAGVHVGADHAAHQAEQRHGHAFQLSLIHI